MTIADCSEYGYFSNTRYLPERKDSTKVVIQSNSRVGKFDLAIRRSTIYSNRKLTEERLVLRETENFT
jgi:hypothetical protein